MSSEIAICVQDLSKCYQIYEQPHDRLKQSIYPRLQRLTGRQPKQYHREFWALKDVSFDVRKGETVGVIGRNGSGKSTLLQLICGTLHPTGGDVQTFGRIGALLELGSGFNPEFTGRENVYMNATVLGLSKDEIDERYDSIVEFAEIGDFIGQPVKTYSSGMFVRLAFAIQANVDPEILIVDEALAVGDAHFVHRCMLRFHQLQEKGTTILFVSHDASAVKRLCKRALHFEAGTLVADGAANGVIDAYLSALFVSLKASPGKSENSVQATGSKAELDKALSGDLREGDQSLEIVSVRLLAENGEGLGAIAWGGVFRLCLGVRDNSVAAGSTICAGYIVRDPRGIEIASTNTVFEGLDLTVPLPGSEVSIEFMITMPMLNAGIYAITPSVSVVTLGTEYSIRDRIVNSVLLTVTAEGPISTPMRFPTSVTTFLK